MSKKILIFLIIIFLIIFGFLIFNLKKGTAASYTWKTKTVDSAGDVGKHTSISAVDNKNIFISYDDNTNDALKFAKSTDGGLSWTIKTIDSGESVGWATSIYAVDVNTIFISYWSFTANRVKFAKSTDGGSSWTIKTVDPTSSYTTSLHAIDANNIFISYFADEVVIRDLRFAKSTDGGLTWVTSTVDSVGDVGWYNSLYAIDINNLFISYRDSTNGDLKFAKSIDSGLTWETSIIDSAGDVGSYSSLHAVDVNTIFISYYDKTNTNKDLKFAFAGPFSNTSLWAWSENIGWISFNCNNPELPAPRCTNNYGVHICESDTDPLCTAIAAPKKGKFTGYAWSENIGWIKFDPPPDSATALYPEDPQYSVRLHFANMEVSGWARACAGTVNGDCVSTTRTDGWDGWIKLRGTATDGSPYGVWIETGVTSKPFHGWAWGSDVVGWISFNCVEGGYDEGTGTTYSVCGTSDYKVITSLNFPPTASNLSWSDKYCNIASEVGQVSFQWLYEDPGGADQSHYHLQIATDSGFTTLVVDSINPQTVPSGSPGTSSVLVVSDPSTYSRCISGGDYEGRCVDYNDVDPDLNDPPYYWQVKVQDAAGKWSDWYFYDLNDDGIPDSFTTPVHAYPWVDFNRCPLSPSVDEIIQFCSIYELGVCEAGACPLPTPAETTCYDADGICNTWEWDFDDDGVIDSTDSNPTHSYSTSGNYIIKLTVYDGDGFSCYHTEDTTVTLPLPGWKEIPPF